VRIATRSSRHVARYRDNSRIDLASRLKATAPRNQSHHEMPVPDRYPTPSNTPRHPPQRTSNDTIDNNNLNSQTNRPLPRLHVSKIHTRPYRLVWVTAPQRGGDPWRVRRSSYGYSRVPHQNSRSPPLVLHSTCSSTDCSFDPNATCQGHDSCRTSRTLASMNSRGTSARRC
jgi:hypothetical protein